MFIFGDILISMDLLCAYICLHHILFKLKVKWKTMIRINFSDLHLNNENVPYVSCFNIHRAATQSGFCSANV